MSGSGRRNADAVIIAALASGATREDAAEAAGVSARTVFRRCEEDAFLAQVEEAQHDLIARSTARLGAATGRAVGTLVELVDVSQPPTVRLGAARAILDSALRWREAEEIEIRLQLLESAWAAGSTGPL